MEKFLFRVILFVSGVVINVSSQNCNPMMRLLNQDIELHRLIAQRDRGVVFDRGQLQNFDFLREQFRAGVDRFFPNQANDPGHRFLADADRRYPRNPDPLLDLYFPIAEHRQRMAQQAAQDRGLRDWVGEHPVAATCIVIGGVTVIGLTVDAIVNGKKSVIGKLFYEDESEEKLQEESLGIEEDEEVNVNESESVEDEELS